MNIKKVSVIQTASFKFLILCASTFFIFNAASASDDYSMISTTSNAPQSPCVLKFSKSLKAVLDTDEDEATSISDTGSVGITNLHDSLFAGAESFCIDSEGNLYVCDTVNNRILIFDHDGNSSRSLKLNNEPDDITTDDHGNLFIYDDQDKQLIQYNQDHLVGTIGLGFQSCVPWGGIHMVNNTIYRECGDEVDLPIGVVENGVLKPSLDTSHSTNKGIFGLSGKRYFIDVTRDEKADIDIYGADEKTKPTKVSILFKGVVSADFLGEDEAGNFYLGTESDVSNGGHIVLSVIKCNSLGKVLNVLTLPHESYRLETIKLLTINNHGDIFQFAPSEEKAVMNVYSQPRN
jgi:DNA-binding beta-propeller fold protein YncE